MPPSMTRPDQDELHRMNPVELANLWNWKKCCRNPEIIQRAWNGVSKPYCQKCGMYLESPIQDEDLWIRVYAPDTSYKSWELAIRFLGFRRLMEKWKTIHKGVKP